MITMMMMVMIIAVKIASCCTFYKCTSVFFVQCCTCFITCHGRLEPRVVITRHLVSPEVVTSVFVVIVLVRSTHKGALQHVRIGVRTVVIVPVTNLRRIVTGTKERGVCRRVNKSYIQIKDILIYFCTVHVIKHMTHD